MVSGKNVSGKKPRMALLGTLNELVKEGGSNNKDGWYHDRTPDSGYRPSRPTSQKPSFLSWLFFR